MTTDRKTGWSSVITRSTVGLARTIRWREQPEPEVTGEAQGQRSLHGLEERKPPNPVLPMPANIKSALHMGRTEIAKTLRGATDLRRADGEDTATAALLDCVLEIQLQSGQ